MALSPGNRLGPFEIVGPLGAGGMGEVYRAKDTRLGREVAVKVLPEHLSSNPEIRARFEREAKTVSSLNHPHICTLHDVGREGDTDYLVMELIDGETLAARLMKGALPPAEVLKLGAQIADALDRAHRAGVMHRDLKPGNVMLTRSGAKLMDFGLARASGLGATSELTSSPTVAGPLTAEGTILGTFQYMAPEQLEGREADARADLWALGCVLYEMATGKRAFEGKSQASLITAIMGSEPAPIAQLSPLAPAALDRLVGGCLAKDPAERIQSAHDVKLQLQWIAAGGSQTGVPAPVAVAARRKGREALAWSLLGAIAILAVVMAVRSPWGRSGTEATGPLYFSLSTPLVAEVLDATAIAPDGMRVAFLARLPEAATYTIFVRSLREAAAKPLAGTEGVSSVPVFSPDGKWLVFLSHNRGLKKIPADGGSAVDLASGDFRHAQVAWLEKGRILITGSNWEQPGVLHEIPESGGSPVALPGRPEQAAEAVFDPKPLPGGRAVLLLTGRDQTALVVQSLDTGERKVLARNARSARFVGGNVVWFENDRLMSAPFDLSRLELTGTPAAIPTGELFAGDPPAGIDVSANGSLIFLQTARASKTATPPEAAMRLVWIDRSGKRTPGPESDAVRGGEPRLSPDDTHAVVDGSSGQSATDVWTIDLRRGTLLRLSFSDIEDETGVWSPDGAWIAWAGARTGKGRALYRRRSDGSGKEEELWNSGALHFHAAAWTPDGRGILVTVDNPKTGFDVLLITLSPQPAARPLLTGPFNETSVRISPDGRWIVYASDESGRSEIYAQAFPDLGSKIQISFTGGQEPVWRPSGGEIVYRSTASREFLSVAVEGQGALAVSPPRVLASDAGLYRGDIDHTGYAVARDGRLLAVQEAPSDAKSEIRIVLGWAHAAGLIR